MTTLEHSLVGIHMAIAVGAHQRFGWSVVALAGIASNVPDWDGLPMLIDMARFEAGHRVWGHNFLVIFLTSLLLAWTQSKYGWLESLRRRLSRFLPPTSYRAGDVTAPSLQILFAYAFVSQALHLPCDMVVSGGNGLTDWQVKPFWPFSDQGRMYPLIPWGDVGPTIILMCGAIALAKLPTHARWVSFATLGVLCTYLLVRGFQGSLYGT